MPGGVPVVASRWGFGMPKRLRVPVPSAHRARCRCPVPRRGWCCPWWRAIGGSPVQVGVGLRLAVVRSSVLLIALTRCASRSRTVEKPFESRSTLSTTLMIAFCFLREITSRLRRACAYCGKPTSLQVRRLSTGESQVDNQGINPGLCPQGSRRRRVVHRCPPVIHRISTDFVPRPVDSGETQLPRCPQFLQQEIHRRPQAVESFVTLRVCPHRFPQELSTSVGDGATGCPPLGITSCECLWISVDNVGTKRSRSAVDKPSCG